MEPDPLTDTPLLEGYGLTECSPLVSVCPYDLLDYNGSIGLPVCSTEIRLVDDKGQVITELGAPGEMQVRGPQVMTGYWQRPEATAEVMQDGWLCTGDIAVCDQQGFFKIVDRKKDMILVSGFNVFPNEIEDVLMQHPSVRECVAVGVPDARKGEAVKVFVSLKDDAADEQALLEHCRQYLTGYKMPSYLELRDELPKTAVGKLLRRQLRDEARGSAG